ncbi:MAG: hypothetical protein OXI03_05515 [Chloroflexota bacterium]|nr:hypothetical protein [Chloroflexota bacterium]
MRRQLGWTILSVVALAACMIPISCDYESGSGSSSSSTSSAARDASAEDRRKGFHCLDPWDGNHNGMEALIRDELNDPGSMETIETRITPVDADGQHTVRLEFTAKNAFGGRVRHTAYGWVDQASCRATLGWIE